LHNTAVIDQFSPDPYQPDPDLSGLTLATMGALGCLHLAAAVEGGTVHVTSAYRPQAYQSHFLQVWDMNEQLQFWNEPECSEMRQRASAEMTLHQLVRRPALVSSHSFGTAFDAVISPATLNRRDLAAGCGLVWNATGDDPVHFSLAPTSVQDPEK
jgi:hypothetical protein